MLALWGWSLVPPIENWDNPNEDGFSYVPIFYTTITCLPVGIYLLVGAIAGHGRYVSRARIAFLIAAGIALLVVTFLVVQHIANNNDGKVFGIQIGFQLDHEDGHEKPIARFGHFAVQTGMSALLPIADMCSALADVRFVPKADIAGIIRSLHLRRASNVGDTVRSGLRRDNAIGVNLCPHT